MNRSNKADEIKGLAYTTHVNPFL